LNPSICGRNGYFTNELAEVLILAKRINPIRGPKNIDIQYFDDERSSKNIAMSRDGSIEKGWTSCASIKMF
jgi:hypothetical protein